ncbi:MAG: sensor histidine kinase [Planctomycetota bacterium]|jgi:PAS domain S-box-containing protein
MTTVVTTPGPVTADPSELEASVRENAQRFEAVARHVPGVVYSYDFHPGGRRELHYLGPGFEDIIGPVHAAQVREDFDRLFELIHPDEAESVRATAVERTVSGETFDHECRLLRDDGEYAWVRSVSRPIRLDTGAHRWHVVLIDVTERKRVEHRERLLARELDHRVKNNMAAVLSLAEQTIGSAESLADFRVTFTGRIRSMAATHEALASRRWEGVEMGEVLNLALAAFMPSSDRISVAGPRVLLGSRLAMPVGLVLHELVTNAIKHGALGEHGGRVDVRWERAGESGLTLMWHEQCSTPIEAPEVTGLGLDLMHGLVEREIRGRLLYAFPAGGLRCEIRLRELT